jgi:hypothetical protein
MGWHCFSVGSQAIQENFQDQARYCGHNHKQFGSQLGLLQHLLDKSGLQG